jgi:hypothetical protein
MAFYPNGDSRTLSDSHRRMLEQGSAIAGDVIAESGARTIQRGSDLPAEFSERQQRRAPGILFVTHRPNGSTSFCFRPDKPNPDSPGHKYEQPCKSRGAPGNVLDVLPSQRHLIADTSVPVIFVEGTKKMLSLVSAARKAGAALLVVAVTACWNWMADGKPIPDLLDIPLQGRKATVMYDSDMLRKPEVQGGAKGLAEYLQGRGAEVFVTYFEDAADGSKVGADDHFVAGGTLAELRMLTRRYDPQDFALVRLTRDERLAAKIGDLERSFWSTEWQGQGGHTDRDVALVLIKSAAEYGRPVEGGVFVTKAWADPPTEVKVGPRTISKSITRLEKIGLIVERVKGKKPHKRGGFLLRASESEAKSAGVYQIGTEREAEQKGTHLLHSLYAATIHPRAPRLCWSSPGSRSKRGTVKGSRKVRQSKPAEPKPAIRRPGKVRGALIDTLDAFERAGGRFTLADLCAALHRKRPRDLTRRKKPGSKGRDGLAIMLIDAGIVDLGGGTISLTADWRERLDDLRRAGREIDSRVELTLADGSTKEDVVEGAETIARRRLEIKRRGFREHLNRGRSRRQETSKAGRENVKRSRAKRATYLANEANAVGPQADAAEREKRRRVEKLVREGMARHFAEEAVHNPVASPSRRPEPKMPPKVGGVYVHGAGCECEWCVEDVEPRYACSRRSA